MLPIIIVCIKSCMSCRQTNHMLIVTVYKELRHKLVLKTIMGDKNSKTTIHNPLIPRHKHFKRGNFIHLYFFLVFSSLSIYNLKGH